MTPDFDRERLLREQPPSTRGPRPFLGSPAFVGSVVTATPAPVGKYLILNPLAITGPEVEGGAGSYSTGFGMPPRVPALLLGPHDAATGDYLIARFVGYRWVCEKGTPGGGDIPISIPGCPCASQPPLIDMTSSKPASNNQIFQSAFLQYGPTPGPLLPVVLTPNSYLSTASFPDPILSADFRYFLTCSLGAYILTRVYVTSPFGSPFRDSIRYKWVPGFPGNICTPFSMTNGQIFAGGDSSCIVTLSG